MPKMPTFFRYIGGKHYIVNYILEMIPKHKIYVEVFLGSGKVFFNKAKSKIDVINDYDKAIANLFYCVAFHFEEFYNKVKFIHYSRTLHKIFYSHYKNAEIVIPDVDMAVKTYCAMNMSFAGKISSFGYELQNNSAQAYRNKINKLYLINERLSNTYIENLDFEEVIEKYDTEETFFYVDPPYYNCEHYYNHFTNKDHERLLAKLKTAKGKWLLSGYANEFYDNFLREYNRKEVAVMKPSYGVVENSKMKVRPKATEILWYNYDLDKGKNISLF